MNTIPVTPPSASVSTSNLDWRQIAIISLASLGVLDTLYLVWAKVVDGYGWCSGIGDCATVNNSVYSELFGIPIAVLGLLVYLVVLAVSALEARRLGTQFWVALVTFGLSLVGTIYSVWLTYVAMEILDATCPFCVISAVLITAILVVSSVRVWGYIR